MLKSGPIEDGLVRIYKSDLVNLGVNMSIVDPGTFKLFESGKEKPIIVSGENDGSFDENDYIEFWGSKNYTKDDYHS